MDTDDTDDTADTALKQDAASQHTANHNIQHPGKMELASLVHTAQLQP